MTINIVFKKIGYSICIGNSAISKCVYWFSITKEFYENKQIWHANWVCGWFLRKKFRKRIS